MDTRPINVLSICSGYGGIELGLHAALAGRSRTVCYVENEIGVASILAARMEDGSLDPAPIWSDLTTFEPAPWRGRVDILAGGFPCQPHSVAGSQLGEDDPRELSGEVLRIAAGLGYPALFLENVPGILRFYWDSIRPQLREMGYRVEEGLFTAAETGAPHKRERLFILAQVASVDDTKGTRWGVHNAEDTGTIYGDVYTSPDASNHELAHAERGATERLRHNLAPTSRGVEGEMGEQRIRPDAGDGGNELAHASESGIWDQSRAPRGGTRVEDVRQGDRATGTVWPSSTSPILDDAEHDGLAAPEEPRGSELRTRHGEAGEIEPEQPTGPSSGAGGDSELAHADRAGSQGWDERGDSARERAARTSSPELGELPLYPPGPTDHEGWAYMLSIMPEAQPTFCRDADGAPTGVDRRLRAVGNGVVPAVAALAFRELAVRQFNPEGEAWRG